MEKLLPGRKVISPNPDGSHSCSHRGIPVHSRWLHPCVCPSGDFKQKTRTGGLLWVPGSVRVLALMRFWLSQAGGIAVDDAVGLNAGRGR